MKKKIAIIGAGPSGIISSIILSKKMDVVLFEKMPRIGKKIIASGNGKCNITNIKKVNGYTYNNSFAERVYDMYDSTQFRSDLAKYGILTKVDSENRVYPISNSSNSVVDNFLYHLDNQNVKILTDTLVIDIKENNNKFSIITTNSSYNDFDYVIISTGGKSNKQLGSNGEGYGLLKKLNIKITKLFPGLVGLKINKNEINGLDGIRQKARVTLIDNNKIIFDEVGEVQFKKDGISGIVVMNASSVIARSDYYPLVKLDLVPYMSKEELIDNLSIIKKENPTMDNIRILKAFLPKMLALNIYNKLGNTELEKYVDIIKEMPLNICGTYDFDNSQVTVGGVELSEINDNFELNKHKNIYVIGELLDVDGVCGGYNLHFAFASGKIASKSILKKEGICYE